MFTLSSAALAEGHKWRLGLEAGPVWQDRNDVQIPSATGTRFSLADLAGEGPYPFYRFELLYDIDSRHSLRFLLAPFEYDQTGMPGNDVSFNGQVFTAGQATRTGYRFNSYRATYRYRFYYDEGWTWRIGVTAKIRDAEISLEQTGKKASYSNTGLVPLLNLYGEYRLASKWVFMFDFDGLASPQGRAIDLGLLARYDISPGWYIGGGYRFLEGGADNEEVYNFALFNYLTLTVGHRF